MYPFEYFYFMVLWIWLFYVHGYLSFSYMPLYIYVLITKGRVFPSSSWWIWPCKLDNLARKTQAYDCSPKQTPPTLTVRGSWGCYQVPSQLTITGKPQTYCILHLTSRLHISEEDIIIILLDLVGWLSDSTKIKLECINVHRKIHIRVHKKCTIKA